MTTIAKTATAIVSTAAILAVGLAVAPLAHANEKSSVTCTTSQGSNLRSTHEWKTTQTAGKGFENVFTAVAASGAESVTVVSGWKTSKPPKDYKPTRSATVYAKSNKTKVTVTLHKNSKERCDFYALTYTKALPTPPEAPTKLAAKASSGQVRLTWSAPTSTGGEKLTSYNVYTGRSATGPWEPAGSPGTKTAMTVPNLDNGTRYWFRVTASNVVGEGKVAVVGPVTPVGGPSEPRNLTATDGDKQVTLSWLPPANNGGAPVSKYTVYRSASSDKGPWTKVGDGNETFRTVTKLTNGTTYWFRVTASNTHGEGNNAIAGPITPAGAPSAPRTVKATAANQSITVEWSAPLSDGGAPITSYSVYHSRAAGGPWTLHAANITTLATTVTGLTNGIPHWVRVTANNRTGESAPAAAGPVTPFTIPDAPRSLNAAADDRKITLTWTAPLFDGGAAVKDYIVQYRLTGAGNPWQTFADGTSSRTSATVTGLTNGTAYDFQVAASNAAGIGTYTSISGVVPLGKFLAPTVLSADVSDRTSEQLTLTYDPGNSGGRVITGVEYSIDGGVTWLAPVAYTNTTLLTRPASATVNGYSYIIRVIASNGEKSPESKIVSKPTTRPTLAIAQGKKVRESEGAALDLSWKSSSRATFYKIMPTGGNGNSAWNMAGASLKFKHEGLKWNTSYGYIITACNAGGCATYSTERKGTTNPRPAAWEAKDGGGSKLDVTVPTLPPGAQSYRIRYCDATDSPGCDPDKASTFNRAYKSTGTQKLTVKTGRTYNVIVVYCTGTNGSGNHTVTEVKNIRVTSK